MAKKLNLTRDQIAGFVGDDPRSVKQLEKLISDVQSLVTNQSTESANTIASLRAEIEDLKAQIQAARKRDLYTFDQSALPRGVSAGSDAALAARTPPVDQSNPAGFSRPRDPIFPKRYGMFYRESVAAPAGPNAVNQIQWENPGPQGYGSAIQQGAYLLTPTKIVVQDSGVYNVEISAQFKCTEFGGTDIVALWVDTPGGSNANGFSFNQRNVTLTGGSASFDEYQFISFSVKGFLEAGTNLVSYWRSTAGITSLYGETIWTGLDLIPAAMLSITKDS